MNQQVLDPCCGSKMFWFDNDHPDVLFGDIRDESHILCDGRKLEIKPDQVLDFRNLPFDDESFKLVVFDPPHLVRAGENGWQKKKYGKLGQEWKEDIKNGFKECFRVLATGGVLIFKWNETQIKTSEILKLTDVKPLFGHVSGKRANTHWVCFMKTNNS
ncbi:class I SAM-dependent methyltransferase [Pseudoalteromonas spongiae]|uniref:class I SAM-dependent methyltransferase n=1 Tax=Pseudoalteromonas spongiae TaxID=298657 RepID=UPI000C2D2333|nr:class I SAM-dependent methyltransferase [Pseudoalteromonas spongiae]